MQSVTTISLPENLLESEKHLFESYLTFTLAPLKIKNLKNVFVGNTGLCLNKKGLIKESHHDYPQHHFLFLKEASFYYYDVEDNPENLIYLNDNNSYLLIHHPWFMYYHWIFESIFRLWMVKDKIRNMILLLPEHYGELDFVMSSLEPFNIKEIYFIPKGKSLYVKNLCVPQIKTTIESYDRGKVMGLREFYLNYALNEKKIQVNKGERIYISRAKAARKKVANEADILPILVKYGFTILNNEDYNFFEQISIYSNAKYIVSIHGSGLTNMLFMKNDSYVLGFQKKLTNSGDWHSLAFLYMANALRYKYYHQICNPTDLEDDYFNANYIVDVDLLDKNLAMMFA